MIVRWSTAAVIVVSAALVGFAVWLGGVKGLANRAESVCLADLGNHLGHGAYEISRNLWLPSFECRLLGNAVEPIVVQHPIEAMLAFGWVMLVPVLFAVMAFVLALRRALSGHAAVTPPP